MNLLRGGIFAVIAVLGTSMILGSFISADNTNEEQNVTTNKNSVNSIHLIVDFYFPDGAETISSFNVFKQMSGYDRTTPTFLLQGTVDPEKKTLYDAIDYNYKHGLNYAGFNHKYSDLSIKVSLQNSIGNLRQFSYGSCNVSDYYIDTLNDGIYSEDGTANFAFVDVVEFECKSLMMHHPYEVNNGPVVKQIGNGKYLNQATGEIMRHDEYLDVKENLDAMMKHN